MGEEIPRYVWAKLNRPSGYINLRSIEGLDIADVPEGTRLQIIGADEQGRLQILAYVAGEVVQDTDPNLAWLWPVDATPRIAHPFNEPRPNFGANHLHEGLDIGARSGTRVRAVADGTITKVWNWRKPNTKGSDAYGNWLIVSHDDGYSSIYCHLSAFVNGIALFKRVARDETLGLAGSTGNSSAAHLHFMATHPTLGLMGYVFPRVLDPAPLLGQ